MQSQRFSMKLIRKRKIAQQTWMFTFDRSNSSFDFTAGQYAQLLLPSIPGDESLHSRLLTMTSSPSDRAIVTFTFKEGESIFKQTIFSIPIGTAVDFFGPIGVFTHQANVTGPVLFLSGGVGIAPFYSIFQSLEPVQLDFPIQLLAAFSTPADVIFQSEISHMTKSNSQLRADFFVTTPNETWQGVVGRIDRSKIARYISHSHNGLYYVCGSMEFIVSLVQILQSFAIPNERIKKEQFTGFL